LRVLAVCASSPYARAYFAGCAGARSLPRACGGARSHTAAPRSRSAVVSGLSGDWRHPDTSGRVRPSPGETFSTEVIHRSSSRPGDKSTTGSRSVDKSPLRTHFAPRGAGPASSTRFPHSTRRSDPFPLESEPGSGLDEEFFAQDARFRMIDSVVHRTFAQPVDNSLGVWIPVDSTPPKFRCPQGNPVNRAPAASAPSR
jgi:hypothetical protein